MSKSAFRKKVTNRLLQNYTAERNKTVAQAARVLLQSSSVQQCLILDQDAIVQFQRGFEAGIGRKLEYGQISSYRKALKNFIEGESKDFPDKNDTKTRVFKDLLKKNNLKFGVNVFYMPYNFNTIKINITNFHKKHFEEKLSGNKDNYDVDAQGRTTHLDHGADGVASGLFGGVIGSFSLLQDPKAPSVETNKFSQILRDNIDHVWSNGLNSLTEGEKADAQAEVMNLVTFAEQLITKQGDVRAGLTMLLTPVDKETNIKRGSRLEREIQNAFLQAFEMTFEGIAYEDLEGSSSLSQKVEKFIVLDKFADKLAKGPNVSIKSNQKKSTKTKTKTKDKSRSSSKKSSKIKPIPPRGKKARPAAVRQQAGSNIRLASLVGVINQKLPQTVKKNMNAPRLRNRTGRFASSVQIVDYARTPRGYPSLGYTYQKFPYQTFEPGYAQGTNERDPRKLIDYSIREIASQLAIGRFFTRRV